MQGPFFVRKSVAGTGARLRTAQPRALSAQHRPHYFVQLSPNTNLAKLRARRFTHPGSTRYAFKLHRGALARRGVPSPTPHHCARAALTRSTGRAVGRSRLRKCSLNQIFAKLLRNVRENATIFSEIPRTKTKARHCHTLPGLPCGLRVVYLWRASVFPLNLRSTAKFLFSEIARVKKNRLPASSFII